MECLIHSKCTMWINQTFKSAFLKIFCCCCFRHSKISGIIFGTFKYWKKFKSCMIQKKFYLKKFFNERLGSVFFREYKFNQDEVPNSPDKFVFHRLLFNVIFIFLSWFCYYYCESQLSEPWTCKIHLKFKSWLQDGNLTENQNSSKFLSKNINQ